jgi:hypothetical protein
MAAVMGLVVTLWLTEALPLAVTAMLGPCLAVVLGIATGRQPGSDHRRAAQRQDDAPRRAARSRRFRRHRDDGNASRPAIVLGGRREGGTSVPPSPRADISITIVEDDG